MSEQVSAAALIEHIEEVQSFLRSRGEELNEGAARVLDKLRTRNVSIPSRRTWIRLPDGFAMWDVIGDDELAMRGYVERNSQGRGVTGDRHVTCDSLTYWTSDSEHGRDLWVGLPLLE